jgi:ribosomal protein S13
MFKYPASWKLRELPEGDANKDIRFVLQGPHTGSFTVVIDRTKKITKKAEFENAADHSRRVGELMEQTLAQIYRSISENINAVNMRVGEQSDLSNDVAIKFYLATLHTMKQGKPIIVAGIHCLPFDRDYSVNFTMTTFWDPVATQENETLVQILNSFRLVGELPARRNPEGPGAGKPAP